MTKNNSNLHNAKRAKNDEFYTRLEDIENECQHYVEHFKDQWIYLPCDDEKSNFWKYFVEHFYEFKLRHLTATHINFEGQSYRLDFDGTETTKTPLQGNGDFRSEECSQIRDDADLICTNPPFSLLRSFIYWIQGGNFKLNEKGEYEKVSDNR